MHFTLARKNLRKRREVLKLYFFLLQYLVRQVAMTKSQRMQHLREFVKDAKEDD